jgi:AraC-like DNA-binding protein
MSRLSCALPDAIDPLAESAARVRTSEHRWSAEFAVLLGSWAAACPTLVVLGGGRAILSDVRTPGAFVDHVEKLWLGAHRHAADIVRTRARGCTVLRYDPGTDVAVLREQASGAPGTRSRRVGTPLIVQLKPAAYLRFLCRRRAGALGVQVHAVSAERDALGLLRHVLLTAWPCGQRGISLSGSRQARHRALAFEAQAAISNALAERHPLAELARSLDTSPFHLAHVFRSEIGISLHQYLLQLRLIAALERLDEGEPDLSKLALDLGFSHHSHFSTQFRRVIGVTPRQARRMLHDERVVAVDGVGAASHSAS